MPVGCGRGDLAGVVRLNAADRDERVAALRECVGDQILELAGLVTAKRKAAVAIVALRPHLRAAEMGAGALEPMNRRRAEDQRVAFEGFKDQRRSLSGSCRCGS